jgi:tetraacyldisaccharide 4'-kinase
VQRVVGRRVPVAVASLQLDEVRAVGSDERRPLASLAGRSVLAVAAVGDPESFFAQLAAAGAHVEAARFRDHHRFTGDDVRVLARRGAAAEMVVCTLKDAVKLRALWPRAAPALWYVSQRVALEREGAALRQLLRDVLAAPAASAPPAGSRRLT